jgi:predicted nucleotidyltransferase
MTDQEQEQLQQIEDEDFKDSLTNKSKIFIGSFPEQIYSQLKVMLIKDGLKRHMLFSALVEGYINDEPEIRKYINRVFAENNTKKVNDKLEKIEKEKQVVEQELSQQEIENIYDFLENEDYFEF